MTSTIKLNGNQEHGGIAMVILITMVVAVVISYLALIRLLPSIFGGDFGDYLLITVFLALFLGVGFVALIDPYLKKIWPSGYALYLDGHRIRFEKPRSDPVELALDQEHQVTLWYFKMTGYSRYGRERQIRKGNYCLGCQVNQEGARIVVHTFISPLKFGRTFEATGFTEIDMDEIYETGLASRLRNLRTPTTRPEIPASLIVSDRGQYWLAERHRWEQGVELTVRDFKSFVDHLRQY